MVELYAQPLGSANYQANMVYQRLQFKWIKLHSHSPIEGTNELTAAEIAAIQKENLRLKQDVETTMTIFAQDFTTEAINKKWVADITYIHTVQDGWCYLASVQGTTKKIGL